MGLYCDRLNHLTSSISVLAITIGLIAGQSASQKSLAQTSTTPPPTGVVSINGAGASTISTLLIGTGTTAPLDPKGSWFNVYGVGNPPSLNDPAGAVNGSVNSTVTFRYAPIGAIPGVRAFLTQTVPPASPGPTILAPISFTATDEPLPLTDSLLPAANTPDRVTGTPNDVPTPSGSPQNPIVYVQAPVIGVGIALAYNRNGLTIPAAGLKLSRNTYLGILNGTITNWNAPQIKADNGGATIAVNLPIKVVRRSDDSGSTFVLSNHLKAAFGTSWVRGVGNKSIAQAGAIPNPLPPNTVVWPASFLSASGGGGVATAITSNPGAIGYVDSATRLAKSLPAAILQNKAGNYIAISPTSIGNAFTRASDTDPNARRIKIQVPDPQVTTLTPPLTPAETTQLQNAYPIVSATYLLFYDKYADVSIANGIKGFINWALGTPGSEPTTNPNTIAIARGYAPLPDAIKTLSRNLVNTYVDDKFNPAP